MRISKRATNLQLRKMRSALALFTIAVMLVGTLSQAMVSFAEPSRESKPKRMSDDQRIVHVLNRLGFGARPGDVERVKAMGIDNYIDLQLHPEKISDTLAENKLKDLSVLSMSTAELYEKFPQPGQLLRQLQSRGVLPSDLAEARDNRVKGGANATTAQTPAGEMVAPADATKNGQPQQPPAGNPLDNEKYRAAIQEYYRQNGLQQPQRIIVELQASRIMVTQTEVRVKSSVYSQSKLRSLPAVDSPAKQVEHTARGGPRLCERNPGVRPEIFIGR